MLAVPGVEGSLSKLFKASEIHKMHNLLQTKYDYFNMLLIYKV